MNHFKIRASVPGIFFKKKYGYVLLASLDCPVLNALSAHHKNSLLISFDDGLANVFEHSPYHTGRLPLRAGIVHLLLGSSRISTITERISCHYTIFNGIKSNICASRHVYLDILPVSHGKNLSEGKTKLFVGQPFKEILSNRQLDILRKALLAMKFDYYIKHPREIEPLVDHMPLFRKDEMLAEEAVLAYSSSCNIELFGCTSTSLFLLAGRVKAVNAILPISMKNIDSYLRLAEQLGVNVILI